MFISAPNVLKQSVLLSNLGSDLLDLLQIIVISDSNFKVI